MLFSKIINIEYVSECQNLSDEGLSCVAKCKNLVSLNLTW